MLLAQEVKGELARIQPALACCRRAELAGLAFRDGSSLSTLDPATMRVAVRLGAVLGAGPAFEMQPGRHHRRLTLAVARTDAESWRTAAACDQRAFLRGVVLSAGSLSLAGPSPHVEFVFARPGPARQLRRTLSAVGVRSGHVLRRGRHVIYLKALDDVAALLRVSGAHRSSLELESARVGRDIRNRLNRLLNAEGANVGRTVRAARRQLWAIEQLAAAGRLEELPAGLRAMAEQRRAEPAADLDDLARALAIGRSAANHRLRRLVELAGPMARAGEPGG